MQSMGLQRVGHNLRTEQQHETYKERGMCDLQVKEIAILDLCQLWVVSVRTEFQYIQIGWKPSTTK